VTDVDGAALGRAAAQIVHRSLGGPFRPGLTPASLDRIESQLGVAFAPEHREFLASPLPSGPRWPDWHAGLPASLTFPAEGVLFDIEHNAAWHREWGPRPAALSAALELARSHLATVPVLLPVYSHRYLPAAIPGAPVLSVQQTDIIVAGADLADWAANEFTTTPPTRPPRIHIPFWSDIADAAGLPGSLENPARGAGMHGGGVIG
jgi:hypothetical protein